MADSLSSRLAAIVLPDSTGARLQLGSLWANRPAAIVFLRHYGWIFCREHVAQLRQHQAEFSAKGVNLAAIGLGDMNYARIFREDTGIDFPLLVDEKREAYRVAELKSANLLHLLRSDNAAARKRAKAAGHRQHKMGESPFQLGGSFVFGPGNIDHYAQISRTFGGNAPVLDLLAAI